MKISHRNYNVWSYFILTEWDRWLQVFIYEKTIETEMDMCDYVKKKPHSLTSVAKAVIICNQNFGYWCYIIKGYTILRNCS